MSETSRSVLRALPELLEQASDLADERVVHATALVTGMAGHNDPETTGAARIFDAFEHSTSGSVPSLVVNADNLDVLALLAASGRTVDLIYIDPPFASGTDYAGVARVSGGASVAASYTDRWVGGVVGYLEMLAPRLMLMRRVLAPAGSIYVHLDWHASHYVKVVLDEIFGAECFLNDIAWLYGLGGSSRRYWPRKHDSLLWYSCEPGAQWFEPDMIPATSSRMKGSFKKAPDYWHIPSINNQAHERTGYATQKPLALLERVVRSSCPPGGTVADFFAGSGTTAVAATALGRQAISVDSSAEAVRVAAHRLGLDEGEILIF